MPENKKLELFGLSPAPVGFVVSSYDYSPLTSWTLASASLNEHDMADAQVLPDPTLLPNSTLPAIFFLPMNNILVFCSFCNNTLHHFRRIVNVLFLFFQNSAKLAPRTDFGGKKLFTHVTNQGLLFPMLAGLHVIFSNELGHRFPKRCIMEFSSKSDDIAFHVKSASPQALDVVLVE